MKILQIFKGVLMSTEGVVNGGLEKVVVDTHELLLKNGYDSHIIDSTESKYAGTNVHPLLDSSKSSKNNNKNIADFAQSFDAIVVHSHSSIVSYLNDRKVPFVFVDHLILTSVNRLFHEKTFNQEWERAKSNGSRYVTVSKVAQEFKEEQYTKWNSDFAFDGHIKFQFVTKELRNIIVQPAKDYAIVIARPSSEKKIHLIADLGVPFQIFSMKSEYTAALRNDHEEYYEKKLQSLEKYIKWNATREDTMNSLSGSFAYHSTAPIESAGISAFEALCSGVPVILNETKRKHASRIFAPSDCDYICGQSDTESVERFRGFGIEKRQQIASEVRDFNSPESFLDVFISTCQMTQNTPPMDLSAFMS